MVWALARIRKGLRLRQSSCGRSRRVSQLSRGHAGADPPRAGHVYRGKSGAAWRYLFVRVDVGLRLRRFLPVARPRRGPPTSALRRWDQGPSGTPRAGADVQRSVHDAAAARGLLPRREAGLGRHPARLHPGRLGARLTMNVPHPSAILRLLGFAVAAGLAMAGIQPVLAATTGSIEMRWAFGLTAPAVLTAGLVFGAARVLDRGDAVQPPWYSAWLLLPGAFLLAGAAAMCIFGALVELTLIPWTMWVLLITGGLLWTAAMVLVRSHSSPPH